MTFCKLHYIYCVKTLRSGSCFLNDFIFSLLPLSPPPMCHLCPLVANIISFKQNLTLGKREFVFLQLLPSKWPVFEKTLWEASLPWLLLRQHQVPPLISTVPNPCFSYSAFYTAAIIALFVFSLKRLWDPRGQELACLYSFSVYRSSSLKCSANVSVKEGSKTNLIFFLFVAL